jgi:hypothetical protein
MVGRSRKAGTAGRTGKDKVETKNVRGVSKRYVGLPSTFIDCLYSISFHSNALFTF